KVINPFILILICIKVGYSQESKQKDSIIFLASQVKIRKIEEHCILDINDIPFIKSHQKDIPTVKHSQIKKKVITGQELKETASKIGPEFYKKHNFYIYSPVKHNRGKLIAIKRLGLMIDSIK